MVNPASRKQLESTMPNLPSDGVKKVNTVDAKARILEEVVALLHEGSSVKAERNAKVPARGARAAYREIDVLLTGDLSGYSMRMAIECKNYGKPIDVEPIESFISKLTDIGIPPQLGIYISVHGYTTGASRRAEKEGLRLLTLIGLTADRLATEVREAVQSVVYLMLDVVRIEIESDVEDDNIAWRLLWLQDASGRFCGGLLDLIWAKWRDGRIPTALGDHEVRLRLPRGWYWPEGGQVVPTKAKATVRVAAVVLRIPGQAERVALIDASTGSVDRIRVQGSFDIEGHTYPVVTVHSEDQLQEALAHSGPLRLTTGRIPLPRIRFHMFWPPSDASMRLMQRRLQQLVRQGARQSQIDLSPLRTMSFAEIEGTDLRAMWDPIMRSHPAATDSEWPFNGQHRRQTGAVVDHFAG
jgi:hypothetical protein